jgi:uncharacterized membrane protein YgaE (UPF0421/DUF939 family)
MLKRRNSKSLESSSTFIDVENNDSSSCLSAFSNEPDHEDDSRRPQRVDTASPTLHRTQSQRLTQLLISRTELAYNLQDSPDEEVENDLGGVFFWKRQIQSAQEHGGDYPTRIATASRAALGSGLVFAALVLPDRTNALGAVWVGNIWFHVTLSDSLGASLPNVWTFARSTVLVTLISWPIALLLNYLTHSGDHTSLVVTILFPIVTFLLSFFVLTCPQVTHNMLMLVVMYIILAAPIGNPMIWWAPFGWVATYFICLVIAVIMNIAPFPNLALRTTHQNLNRLENDLTMLLSATKDYSKNNGTNIKLARQAISTIEFMYTRICETVATLQHKLPAAQVELKYSCKGKRAGQDLGEWVKHSETLLQPLQLLRSALMQKVLGEESNYSSPTLAQSKVVINDEISPSRDRLVDTMIASVAVCHAWADPSQHRTVVPDVQEELRASLQECQRAFHTAMCKAADKMGANGSNKEHGPLFAHLTRRMSSFHSLFALAESLLGYLENHGWEMEESKKECPCCSPSFQWWSDFLAFWKQPWKWKNQGELRLALKTSVGMVFAAFFVSMPYLKDLAAPYGLYPGITIASVNLSTTGSSFNKCAGRLMATLVAGSFSMIVADLFPGHHDVVKICLLSVFTFVMIYLRDTDHAYMYTYACISIGCMLFGSVKTDYDIAGYVPQRIELILIGVIIFALIELLLFPRSSRKIVEATALDFVLTTRDFLQQAVKCSQRMEQYVNDSKEENWNSSDQNIIFRENEDPFHLNKLAEEHAKLKAQSDNLSIEINSALAEPSLGLTLPLHPESFRGLVANESSSERQAALLCNALNKLAGYYQQGGHPIRELSSNWPHVHTVFLQEAAESMESICARLQTVFVDGRIRAQRGNSVKAVNAASSFRALEDVRLKIVSDWSDSFQAFVNQNGFEASDPAAIMTLGITTTVILELCRHMQMAGKNMEEIAHRFPTYQ